MIRVAEPSDAGRIAEIYNHYVENSQITFETEAVLANNMLERINAITKDDKLPWLVALNRSGDLVGYAYASKWKGRCAYRFSVESTVYLDNQCVGQGWGRLLMEALFAELAKGPYHAVISGIALPNDASIALHQALGMEKVAHFKQVGYKFEKWVDVGYWQKLLGDEA